MSKHKKTKGKERKERKTVEFGAFLDEQELKDFEQVAKRVLRDFGNWRNEKQLEEGRSLQETSYSYILSPQDKEDILQDCIIRWYRRGGYVDKLPAPKEITEEYREQRRRYFGSLIKWQAKYYGHSRRQRAEDFLIDTEFGRNALGYSRPGQDLLEVEDRTAILETIPANIKRGQEVAQLLLDGYSSRDIARQLHVSQRTVQRIIEQLRYWLAAGSLDTREPVAKKKVSPTPTPQYQIAYIHMPAYSPETPQNAL